jgi:hypothetical protein
VAQITVDCVINGKSMSESAQDSAALTALIEHALKDAGATARPAKDWVVRLDGKVLEHNRSLASQGITSGATLFFSLGGSESGAA